MTPKKRVKLENNNLYLWWTDDEVHTLLECVEFYKSRKKYEEGIDWECIKEQYNIRKTFQSRFPN